MRKIFLMLISVLVITACGGGGGGGGDDGASDVIDASQYYYQEQPGDTITYSQSMDGGAGIPVVYAYTQVDSLDAKYTYTPLPSGPYLKEELTEDTDLTSVSFYTLTGEDILSDTVGLSQYSIIGITNDEEPSQVTIGQTYTYIITENIYEYNNLTLSGLRETTTTITPLGLESVTVGAGTYICLKFSFFMTMKQGITQADLATVRTSEGYLWYGENRAGLVKSEIALTFTGIGTVNITDELSSVTHNPSSMLIPSSSLVNETGGKVPISSFLKPAIKQVRSVNPIQD